MDSLATKELLDSQRVLLAAAHPFLGALSRAAGSARHAAMLGDPQGRVLKVVGDPASVEGPGAVPPPEALLDEIPAGANGLGTPLAERSSVELVGPEHYIAGFQMFTCQGIPLMNADGSVVGVLGMSVRKLETANRVRDILFCAAQGIECELLSNSLTNILNVATRRGTPHGGLAENLRQDLVQKLAASRLKLELAADKMARGTTVNHLLTEAESLVHRFRRLATVWRDLVGETNEREDELAPYELLQLRDLVSTIMELLATEALLAEISIDWGEHHAVSVREPRQRLTRAILSKFLKAIQLGGASGRIQVDIQSGRASSNAVLCLTATPAGGAAPTTLELEVQK